MNELREKLESLSSLKVLVLGIVIGIAVAGSAFYTLRPLQTEESKSGNIKVRDINMAASQIGAGQKTEASAEVINTGARAETRTLKLKIDGNEKISKDVTLASGENKQISFTVSEEKLGDHTAKIGEKTISFEVLKNSIFTSQKYGFVLKYPNDWTFTKNESYTGLTLKLGENKTGGLRPKAQAQIRIQKLSPGTPSLENLEKTLSNQIENNENLEWISEAEIKESENIQEIDLTVKSISSQENVIVKQRTIRSENYQYNIQAYASENDFSTFEEDFNLIIENFVLKK